MSGRLGNHSSSLYEGKPHIVPINQCLWKTQKISGLIQNPLFKMPNVFILCRSAPDGEAHVSIKLNDDFFEGSLRLLPIGCDTQSC